MTRRGRPRQQWWKLVNDIRNRADLTQKQLGLVLGVSQTQVSRWELAVDKPRANLRRKLEVLTA